MRTFGPPVLVSNLSEFGRQQVLKDALQSGNPLVSISPDGQHLFLLLRHKHTLLSFARLPSRAPPPPAAYLEKSWAAHGAQLAGLLFPRSSEQAWLLTIVWESGRVEMWSPPRDSKGWTLLQSADLCNSPRARVASICSCGGELVWCEERPLSESKQLAGSMTNPFNYCICQRSLEQRGQQVTLGSMRIVLHHSPLYRVLASPHHVFMSPASTGGAQLLLVYSPLEGKISISSTARGHLHTTHITEGESDFKKMLFECLGYVSCEAAAETLSSAVLQSGDLLLVDINGHINMLHPDGAMRHIYKVQQSIHPDMAVYTQVYGGEILVCALDTALHLIEINTGRLMETKLLKADLCLLKLLETADIQLLANTGIYQISYGRDAECAAGKLEPALLEMVFEEACKYYQKRSLSSTKLTVEALKKEGVFQAPLALSSILNSCQKDGKSKDVKYRDLSNTMSNDLQSYLSLERLKSHIINAAGNAEQYCDDLVDQEVNRLLQADLDRENLVYLNSLFNMFPRPAWASLRNHLQFQQNGDGRLAVRATSEMWKKVFVPLPSGLKESSPNGVLPLFEIICRSLYIFKPKWLPGFVQQAQECSGLSWNYSSKDNCDGVPLYKRALSVLRKHKDNTSDCDLETELLLCSGRPQAVIQAIHILIGMQQWERVMLETQKFSKLSPLISKNIFITLLMEFVKNRHLDSYINNLYEICPEDMTVTDILRIILQNVPKGQGDNLPFSFTDMHLTVGSLKPLLNKVLENETRHGQQLHSPVYPPSTPKRTNRTPEAEPCFVNGDNSSADLPYVSDIYATTNI